MRCKIEFNTEIIIRDVDYTEVPRTLAILQAKGYYLDEVIKVRKSPCTFDFVAHKTERRC